MKFRFSLGAVLALAILPFLAIASDAAAQAPKNITMTVGVCDPAFGARCAKPDINGALPVTLSGGTAIVGAVKIDQTTPGTTNGVVVNSSALPTGAATAANQTAPQGSVTGGTAGTTSQLAGGTYKATPATLTDGQQAALNFDTRNNAKTTLCGADTTTCMIASQPADAQSATSGLPTRSMGTIFNGSTWDRQRTIVGATGATGLGVTAVATAGASFSNITTNTTTTVKSGAGILYRVCINTKGASANVATIYDNTAGSGTKIGTLDTTSGVACLAYEAAFATGLTLVTATGTAADLTVVYR